MKRSYLMMWGYGTTYTWGGMLLMLLGMLFWFALLGALIWALVRWVTRSGVSSGAPSSPSALEILQQRYARGEIDDATFVRMRQQLLGGASASEGAPPSVSRDTLSSMPGQ
jgi:putative membrane protein